MYLYVSWKRRLVPQRCTRILMPSIEFILIQRWESYCLITILLLESSAYYITWWLFVCFGDRVICSLWRCCNTRICITSVRRGILRRRSVRMLFFSRWFTKWRRQSSSDSDCENPTLSHSLTTTVNSTI